MRPCEVCNLKIKDINWGTDCYEVRDDKTGHDRFVPIAIPIQKELAEFTKGKMASEYVFTIKNKKIETDDISNNFRQRIRKLGIQRNVTLYSCRHSLITRLCDEDVNLYKIQAIAGHRDITTTAIYTHLTHKSIEKAMQQDPIARETMPIADVLAKIENEVRTMLNNDKRLSLMIRREDDKLQIEVKST